jgi:phosphonoacetaldehyde hydrolase
MSDGNQKFAPYRGRLRAVILDWAGTTVDFGSLAPVRTLQKVFARAGVTLTDSEIRQDMGLAKKDHIRKILNQDRVQRAWQGLQSHLPRATDVDRLYEDFIPLQLSCLMEYSAVIPGVTEATERVRRRGLKIGTTTGYTREMLDRLVQAAQAGGFIPDCNLSPDDVGAGRPHPFMIYENAVRLQVYPLSAIVKIGDTPADIHEGLSAGTWSIGVAATGNMIGLSEKEFEALPATERDHRLRMARAELSNAGAHYVVDRLADVDSVLDEIDSRLQSGSCREVISQGPDTGRRE